MKRQTAMKEWRGVTRGAPEGVPTGRTVHAFAQRVEAATQTIEASRRAAMERVGTQLANVAFNWAQTPGRALTEKDAEMLDSLRKQWDEAVGHNMPLNRLAEGESELK